MRKLLAESNLAILVQEVLDLPPEAQEVLWIEVAAAMRAIQAVFKPDKLNQAAIGNLVRHQIPNISEARPCVESYPAFCQVLWSMRTWDVC